MSGYSTEKKSIKSPMEEDPLAGQQILQKNFSATSISSNSVPYSTARVMGDLNQRATSGNDKEGTLFAPQIQDTTGDNIEEPVERKTSDDIFPIKYTQPC